MNETQRHEITRMFSLSIPAHVLAVLTHIFGMCWSPWYTCSKCVGHPYTHGRTVLVDLTRGQNVLVVLTHMVDQHVSWGLMRKTSLHLIL